MISPICPRTRPLGENKAMSTLNILLPENIAAALEAGVVDRWLAKYPFPCAVKNELRRRHIVTLTKIWSADDPAMACIIGILASHRDGAAQLRRHGLMGSMLHEDPSALHNYEDFSPYDPDDDDDDGDTDVWMYDGGDTAGAQPWYPRRQQEASVEEQALRRRRREAMVFSEGGRPLGRDNIIQPIQNDDGERNDLEGQQVDLSDAVNRSPRTTDLENETPEHGDQN